MKTSREKFGSMLPGHCVGWRLFVGLAVGILLAEPLGAQENKPALTARRTNTDFVNLITPATEKAIANGLNYLARSQHPQGSFGSGQYSGNIAVSSLAGLAMLSNGSNPQEGPYAENLSRLVDYVLDNTSRSGLVVVQRATSHGPMYDHGFGTLFLAEVYGMTPRDELREKLKKATQLIVSTQNIEGGWRYQPQRASDADVSVTICQIMALRAARNAGIHVPKSTIDKSVDYVRKCQNPDGGFRYMVTSGPSMFPRSAGGVAALYSAGIYESAEIKRGLEYLNQRLPGRHLRGSESHYFYGQYYAAMAMYQAGGPEWQRWYPAIRDDLLRSVRPDGSWNDSVCSEYGAAMACIVLQSPNSYLPIFQR